MTQVTKTDFFQLNGFELNQKVRTTDYNHLGTIREFGYLKVNETNTDWLNCQSVQWSQNEIDGVVVVLDVLPKGSAIVPLSRLTVVA
jgi:hypothetical protein